MKHALAAAGLLIASCSDADLPAGERNSQAGGPAGPMTLAVPADPDPRGTLPPLDNQAGRIDALPRHAGEALRPRLDRAPADVREAIGRRAACNHWSGEEGYDPQRRMQIAAALREARCDEIEADILAIRSRYASEPAVLRLIEESASLSGW